MSIGPRSRTNTTSNNVWHYTDKVKTGLILKMNQDEWVAVMSERRDLDLEHRRHSVSVTMRAGKLDPIA